MKERPEKRGRGPVSAAGLSREEWDFAGCPRGGESACWEYEYARECPRIVETFRGDAAGRRRGFDQDGYWFYEHQVFDSQGEYEDSVILLVPPGFPDVPYLMTKGARVRVGAKVSARSSRFLYPPKVRDVAGDAERSFGQPPDYVANLYVDWNAPDKELLRDFQLWLSEHRPRKARSRRGRSAARRYMADLKALGAYRLLQLMSAEEALAYTKRFLPHGLYAQVPDWYEAKKRAKGVLRYRFRTI